MPDVVVSERKLPCVRSRWMDRIGAALVAPKAALDASDGPKGQGRASSDITTLLLLAIAAIETELFVTVGWMVGDGEYRGALTVLVTGAQKHLIMPIILLLVGGLALTLLAGKRRSTSRDFDLACVALTPLVIAEIVHSLITHLGIHAHEVAVSIGYGWAAILWLLALVHARARETPNDRESS